MTDSKRMSRVNETKGLPYINTLVVSEFPINKCSFNINLVNFHVTSVCNGKNGIDWCKFSNRSKSIEVINTWHLRKSLGNQMRLVAYNIAYCILFCLEYPFQPYDINSRWWVNELLCISVIQHSKFSLHCFLPQLPICLSHSFFQVTCL